MKKFVLFFFSMLTVAAFADTLVLENFTSYPMEHPKSKLAVQWATSAREVDQANKAITYGSKLNPATLEMVTHSGKITLTIPPNAEHFRIVAWSTNTDDPDLLTNWVDVVPNKVYKVEKDHLVPTVLMSGTGC